MGKFVVGDVVVVKFPFSDLSGHKVRPALVLSLAEFNNLIMCQITSRTYSSKKATKIVKADFSKGGLPHESYVRPDKIFTAEPVIVSRVAGKLNKETQEKILQQVRSQF